MLAVTKLNHGLPNCAPNSDQLSVQLIVAGQPVSVWWFVQDNEDTRIWNGDYTEHIAD
jgi:hypothetical protein